MHKKFLVYFHNLPSALETLPAEDKNITVAKEGLREYGGSVFPRLCIKIRSVSPSEDKDRERKVADLLKYLMDGRQIIDFS